MPGTLLKHSSEFTEARALSEMRDILRTGN